MTITVLLILAVLWAAVLVPPALRSRSEGRRGEPIGPLNLRRGRMFGGSGNGSGLGGPVPGAFRPAAFPRRSGASATAGAPARPAGEMTPAQRRRRDVLVILLGAAGLSLVLAVFTGMITVWLLHLLIDGLLAGYLYLLVQMKQGGGVSRTALPAPIPLERPRQGRHVSHPTRELAVHRAAAP